MYVESLNSDVLHRTVVRIEDIEYSHSTNVVHPVVLGYLPTHDVARSVPVRSFEKKNERKKAHASFQLQPQMSSVQPSTFLRRTRTFDIDERVCTLSRVRRRKDDRPTCVGTSDPSRRINHCPVCSVSSHRTCFLSVVPPQLRREE